MARKGDRGSCTVWWGDLMERDHSDGLGGGWEDNIKRELEEVG